MTTFIALLSLCLTFIAGIYASREVKNMRDYGLSKGAFGSLALTCTIIASFVGASAIIGTATNTYKEGLGILVGLLGFPLQLIFTGILIAPRMHRFPNALSIGDIIGETYGKMAKVLTGVCWFLFCTGIVVAQMTGLSQTLDMLLNIKSGWNLLLGSGIVILYCFLGGIRAVVTTDVIQFFILAISLPLALIYGVYHQGGLSAVVERIPSTYLSLTGKSSGISVICIFLSFLVGDALIPPMVQRLLMARSEKQAKYTMILGGIGTFPFCCIGAGLGFLAYSINQTLDPKDAVYYVFSTVLPPAIQGFAIAGILAVITSSADSYLNSAAVAFVNDIIKPFWPRPLHGKLELYLAKVTTMVIGVAAMLFSLSAKNVFEVILGTYRFWGPVLVVPLLGLFFNKPVTRLGFYLSVAAGIGFVLIWEYFSFQAVTGITSLVVGMFGNFCVYVTCRLMQDEAALVPLSEQATG